MKAQTLSELKSKASDKFSYILVFCPNFPPYTRSTTKTAFEKLTNLIDLIMEKASKEDAKQWLRVCLSDVRQSWKSYEDGNIREGRKMIQRAEEHFNNAFSKKPIVPRFITDAGGATSDNSSGFPE